MKRVVTSGSNPNEKVFNKHCADSIHHLFQAKKSLENLLDYIEEEIGLSKGDKARQSLENSLNEVNLAMDLFDSCKESIDYNVFWIGRDK